MFRFILLIILIFAIPSVLIIKTFNKNPDRTPVNAQIQPAGIETSKPASPKIPLDQPPKSKTIPNNYHVFQTFNNCGPAALSMTLSYYGINITQKNLGDELRPYQNSRGDNDDKSVTLLELGEKVREYNLTPYHRPAGNVELIKYFITNEIPVITRTLLKEDEDIGHYRVVKGYDDSTGVLIQDDSLQGKNLNFKYEEFQKLWKQFNYEYLVLIPNEKLEIAKEILKENIDPGNAWQKAVENSERELILNPNDIYSRFNLSVALYNIGSFEKSAQEFEIIENQLPFRALWYQIEPILAYYHLEKYERVFSLTDKILNNHNRAFSELYLIRGEIYLKHQNSAAAKAEFAKAVSYNSAFQSKIPVI